MSSVDAKKLIYKAFTMTSKRDVNFAYHLVELILKQDEDLQHTLFQYVCENWGVLESSEEVEPEEVISESKYEKYKLLYGEMVDGTLLSYIRLGLFENWERSEFYKQLWKNIHNNSLWNEIEKKAFVIYYIAIDTRTPYFNIGSGLKMSNDDFLHLQDKLSEKIQKFHFVNDLKYEQKTEKASLICNLLEELETLEEKAVLMSYIIKYYEDRTERIIRQLKGGIR